MPATDNVVLAWLHMDFDNFTRLRFSGDFEATYFELGCMSGLDGSPVFSPISASFRHQS